MPISARILAATHIRQHERVTPLILEVMQSALEESDVESDTSVEEIEGDRYTDAQLENWKNEILAARDVSDEAQGAKLVELGLKTAGGFSTGKGQYAAVFFSGRFGERFAKHLLQLKSAALLKQETVNLMPSSMEIVYPAVPPVRWAPTN